MLVNIEMKGPCNLEIRARYDIPKACSLVKELIQEYGIANRTILSSFCRPILDKMVQIVPKRQFKILFLKDDDGPELDYTTPKGMNGLNVDLHYLQQSVIKDIKNTGNTVGVWYK